MKFDVEEVANGYMVKVGESEELHIAKNAKDVAKVVTTALGATQAPKVRKPRKVRGKGKKKAAVAANSDALAGLNA